MRLPLLLLLGLPLLLLLSESLLLLLSLALLLCSSVGPLLGQAVLLLYHSLWLKLRKRHLVGFPLLPQLRLLLREVFFLRSQL